MDDAAKRAATPCEEARVRVYSHHVVGFGPGRRDAVFAHIQAQGVPAITGAGGRLFALFKPLIGLSLNHAILICEWADDALAARSATLALRGLTDIEIKHDDLWDATLRPAPGKTLPHMHGLYSHRRFDVRAADLPRFLELSGAAWDNFETAFGSEVRSTRHFPATAATDPTGLPPAFLSTARCLGTGSKPITANPAFTRWLENAEPMMPRPNIPTCVASSAMKSSPSPGSADLSTRPVPLLDCAKPGRATLRGNISAGAFVGRSSIIHRSFFGQRQRGRS